MQGLCTQARESEKTKTGKACKGHGEGAAIPDSSGCSPRAVREDKELGALIAY